MLHSLNHKGNAVAPDTRPTGPLAGIRILDMTGVVLGPLATQILGDYGADVVKVESLDGDLMRANGAQKADGSTQGLSSIFLAINRNKRSLAIDLKSEQGGAAVRRLAQTADVFVHNMRVEAIERLGFGYEAVRKIKPDIVYCVATGFGQDGPDRARPAFDDVIQAGSGMVSISNVYAERPDYISSLIADKTTGLALVNAVLAALLHKARTGEGQYVETPMLETMTAFVLAEHMGGMTFEPREGDAGYARLLQGGRRPMATKDGWLALLPYTAEHWTAFFAEIGRLDLVEIATDRARRNTHVQELYAAMRDALAMRTTDEWFGTCQRLDIPATRLYALDDLPGHPHLAATGFFELHDHPAVGKVRMTRPPTRFSRTPAAILRHAPRLGEHSRALLAEAGLGEKEIAALVDCGIVKTL
ncbi:MAG: CoA transferase [Hyphomicrobiales bacterium]|nr:CoA transferase [Hyphomicrobiales bacterium]